nr:MAG TPA: Chromatin remodeling complex ATPase [Bacteriophage sp.]
MASFKSIEKALRILKEYNGSNPYILMLQRDIYVNQNNDALGDFQVEFILDNYNKEPRPINKIVKLTDWYAEKKKEDWKLDFIPKNIAILSYLGETTTTYCCYVQYRKSVPPTMSFLSKKGVVGNFLVDDFHNMQIDFDRYDRLSMEQDPKRRLFPHQKEGVQFLLTRKKCILADSMGLGKTSTLSVAAIEGNFDSTVIICPASLKTNWKKELMWYVPEKDITIIESIAQKTKGELEEFLGYSVGKSNKKKEELLEEAYFQGKWQNNRFVIVNYDILDEFYEIPKSWAKKAVADAHEGSPLLKYIYNKKSLIVIDEAHKLSNSTSKRYKIIKDLIKRGNPEDIFLATGTPVTNNPQNLFCLLALIKHPLSNDWNYYMEHYCGAIKIPAKGEKEKWTNLFLKRVGKATWYDLSSDEKDKLKTFIRDNAKMITIAKDLTNLDELKEMISDVYMRRIKEDMEGMVKKTIHEIYYDLTLSQLMEYETLWDEYEAAQKENNPEKVINKDLLEGAIYRRYLSNAMVPYTEKLVDEIIAKGEKIVVFCCFDEELYALKEYYGDKCVIYNGKMNAKQKDAAVEKFMNDNTTMVFIGNLIAAGVGITLTRASNLIFNDLSYVPGDNQQGIDRICRIGQTKDCDIYIQIFRKTQYENIWNIVMKKTLVIDQIIKKEDEK